MSFEFFFGVFGLIDSDSKSRHKSRLDADWRLFTPLGASLFREAAANGAGRGSKSPSGSSGYGGGGGGGAGSGGGLDEALGGSSSGSVSSSNKSSASLDAGAPNKPGRIFSTNAAVGAPIGPPGKPPSRRQPSISPSPTESVPANRPPKGEPGAAFSSASSSSSAISDRSTATLTSASGQHQQQQARANFRGLEAADLIGAGPGKGADADSNERLAGETTAASGATRVATARRYYCRVVCLLLWLNALRMLLGLVVEKSILTLDFYHLGAYRIHYLIPASCIALHVAAVSLLFQRNNNETNWLVPFYSSKDYLIRTRSNFRPKIESYSRRVTISVTLALAIGCTSSVSMAVYLIYQCWLDVKGPVLASAPGAASILDGAPTAAGNQPAKADKQLDSITMLLVMAQNFFASQWSPALERIVLFVLVVADILCFAYSTYICCLVAFYFNLICSIMKRRFRSIAKIIEDLAESNTSKTTNQARKITTLYLEHNEACELLDESNDFWQYLIFFTYFTYIPGYCYCLYNIFFTDFETWSLFCTWVIHTYAGFIILLVSFSAAGVSTEAHAPYTSLHTLSLIQLPLDVEVNIATFLHRVRGLTIGYSCYDLFAITNASMSNTAAACASYFLIVADFSRSSVFNLAQNANQTGGVGQITTAIGGSVANASGAGG